MPDNEPTHDRMAVKRLAADPDHFAMDKAAVDDAMGFGLDEEDLQEIFQRIDEWNFVKTMPTRKKYPHTMSDVYVGFVDECLCRMYIKFVITEGILTVTSFKEDER